MKLADNEITTVVSDFDGTLLREGMSCPSEKFYQVLDEMLEKNIGFVAASGRQYTSLERMLSHVADKIGFIADNGAYVMWKGELVHKCVVPHKLASELIEDLRAECGGHVLVSGMRMGYVETDDKWYLDFLDWLKMDVTILEKLEDVPEEPTKISIIYQEGIPENAKERLKAKYGEELIIVESGNCWLDCMTKDCGKGPALRVLSEKAGFSLEETAAFGDRENDLSMLKAVKVSYAMNTAQDFVKEAAGNICEIVEDILCEGLLVSDTII